ncbi:polyprenyl synthetase family protein [Candidatus Gracilibacteria bacterium]|nr:polyprenyl synthetase family protein [Candidatus Gracilibacteria bacterium]
MNTIPHWIGDYQHEIHRALDAFFLKRYEESSGIEAEFESALRYAVQGGGKRIRPILALIAYEYFCDKYPGTCEISRENVLMSIIGIELIHCFTLVHDDLPCMDNDELRRGKPTVWKVYGETMAVLVGDTLQTMGFECLARSGNARVVLEIANALGDLGVARGQVRDTLSNQSDISVEELLRLHDEKTGVFIAHALVVGAILGGAHQDDLPLFRKYGMQLGRAFQIQDDILDYEGDIALVGKKIGKDVELGKGIVTKIGIDKSKELLKNIESELSSLIHLIGDERLLDIQRFVIKRRS